MTQLPAAMSPEELDRLPRAVADFPLIRARRQIYVDKTDLIHQLAATRDKYFLSRPGVLAIACCCRPLRRCFMTASGTSAG